VSSLRLPRTISRSQSTFTLKEPTADEEYSAVGSIIPIPISQEQNLIVTIPVAENKREPKDLRYRRQFFPDADNLIFETRRKGFVPLPIIFRKLIPHLSAAELRVLIYLQLRISRHGICYPTIDEMVHDLGLTSRKNLTPHLESLADKKFIAMASGSGKRFFLLYDPKVPIQHLVSIGEITKDQLFDINELYKDLGQEPIPVSSTETSVGENTAPQPA
jgi:hypothetical protein